VAVIVEWGAACRVLVDAAVGGAVAAAPDEERVEGWPEVTACVRQFVEVSTRVLGVGPSLEDAVFDQAAEPVGEHRLGDVEVGVEVVETAYSEERVTEDQQRPALADDLQRAGEGAVLGYVVLAEQISEYNATGSLIELVC
jgi:hypothetical protein